MVAKMITLIALGPVQHDGQRYEEGDALDVTEKQAAQLVQVGGAATKDMAAATAAAEKKALAAIKAQEAADEAAEAAEKAQAEAEARARATQEAAANLGTAPTGKAGGKTSK